ncbi:MAG: fasciclin domain-containing protein [Alphaproteobacteria bacterium]|nr:fasciclin domain-containing protein [Alphaproteobacteria bacterium]
MVHYFLAQKPKKHRFRRERWEGFAAFLTFAALVSLAGATYGELMNDNLVSEIDGRDELRRFSGILASSPALSKELKNERHHFTMVAPTDTAFNSENIRFVSDDGIVKDKRIVNVNNENYIIQSEGFVVRSQVMPQDIQAGEILELPAANNEILTFTRVSDESQTMLINGVPAMERIVADNGVIYVVDKLVHPLPEENAAMAQKK